MNQPIGDISKALSQAKLTKAYKQKQKRVAFENECIKLGQALRELGQAISFEFRKTALWRSIGKTCNAGGARKGKGDELD